jgi:hypothetical protein
MNSWLCLGIVNLNSASSMGVQVSLLHADLHSFRYIPRSGIAGSYLVVLGLVWFWVFFFFCSTGA